MSFTLPANSYCPTASAPSLPWRSNIPLFFSATPIPHKAPFNLSACHSPTRSPQPSLDIEQSAAVSPAPSKIAVATNHAAVSPAHNSIADAAPAIGVGALAAAGAVVSAGVGAIVDSPASSQPAGSNSPEGPLSETEVSEAETTSETETSEAGSPAATKLSSPTPIPPHLLSPIPPSRPSVPASFLSEGNIDGSDSAGDASMSVEESLSPSSSDRAEEDELHNIEGDYLDGAEELASATSFGDIEPAPANPVANETSEPDHEAAFLDALEYKPVISMGEVVDESVLNLPADASTSDGIVGEGVDLSTSADAIALGEAPPTATGDFGASSSLPNQDVLGEANQAGDSLGKFLGGLLVCFAIVGALIFLGVRVFQGIGPNDSDPLPESATETE